MHKKFEINWTNIKGGCQSERKVVNHNCKSDLPLAQELLNLNSLEAEAFFSAMTESA